MNFYLKNIFDREKKLTHMLPSIEWIKTKQGYKIKLIDQTKLPGKLEYIEITNYKKMAESIKLMHIRGAPAIGVAAAMGTTLAAIEFQNLPLSQFSSKLQEAGKFISKRSTNSDKSFLGSKSNFKDYGRISRNPERTNKNSNPRMQKNVARRY